MADELNEVEILKEIDSKVDGFMRTHDEFKKTVDEMEQQIKAHGEADAVTKEKLDRIEKGFAEYDDLNADLTKLREQQKAEKERAEKAESVVAELKERLAKAEVAVSRAPVSETQAEEQKHEYFESWARATVKSILFAGQVNEDEKAVIDRATTEAKDMFVGSDTSGGYLAPNEYVRELLRGVVEVSMMRGICSVRSTAARALMIPKRTGTASAGWTAEAATRTESTNPTFGMEEIPTHEMYAMIDISEQNLEDSAFNLEQFIRDEATEQFGVTEGTAIVNGTAVGQPEGILTNSDIGSDNSGNASLIEDANGQANGLIDLYHNLKTAYSRNGTWIMNRTTLGAVRKLKDGQNNYIWVPGLAALRPNTILDAPYVEVPDMPDVAANAFPIAFGDFRRGYIIVDRVSMSMLRDPYTQAAGGLIRFWFRRRVGGQVVISEAIRKLQVAA